MAADSELDVLDLELNDNEKKVIRYVIHVRVYLYLNQSVAELHAVRTVVEY